MATLQEFQDGVKQIQADPKYTQEQKADYIQQMRSQVPELNQKPSAAPETNSVTQYEDPNAQRDWMPKESETSKSPNVFDGIGNLTSAAVSGINQGATNIGNIVRNPGPLLNQVGQAFQREVNPQNFNPGYGLLEGTLQGGANVINGISGIPSALQNALEGKEVSQPAIQIPTGGLEQDISQNHPVSGFLGNMIPLAGAEALSGGAASPALSPLASLGRAAGIGAGYGLVGTPGSVQDRFGSAITNAALGAGLHAGGSLLGKVGEGAAQLNGSENANPISVTGLRGLNNNAGQSSGISTNGNAVVVDNTGSNGNNNGNQDSFLSDEQQDELKSDPITGQPTAPPHTETVSGQIVNEPQQDAPQPAQWFGGRIGQPAPETAAPQPEPATNNKQVQLDQIAHMAASHPDPTIRARYQQVLDQYNQNNQPQETLQQPQSWHKMSPELQAIIQKRQQAAQTPESATGGNPEPQEAPPWEQESTEPESHQEQEEQPQNTAEQQAEILKQQQEAQEAQRQAAIEQQGEALHKHLTNAEKLNPSKKTIQALKEGYLNQAANHPDPNARAAYQYAIDKYAGVEPQAAAIEQTKEENVHHSEQTEQEAVKPKGAENEQVESQTGNTETGEAQQTPVTEQAEPQKSEIEKTQEEPGKESTPEPAQTETATGQGKSIAASLKPESIYTDEVQQQLDQLDAEHKEYRQREEDRTNRNQSYREQANKNIKGHGMETAARKREIIQGDSLESIPGGLTDKELKARIERENSNYTGKKVTVKGKEGKVTRVAFGKVGVQFEDGSNAFFNPDDIKAVPKEKGKSTLREKTSEPASKKNTVDPEALSAIYPEQPYPKEGVLSKTTSQGTESREHFLEAQARKGGTFFHPDELEKIPGGVEAFNNLSDKGKATVQEMADAIHNDKKVYSSFYQTKTPTETGVLTKRSGYKDELYTPKGLMLNKKGKLMIAGVNENSEWSTRDPEQFTGKVEKTTETRYKGLYAHPSEIGEGENFHPNEAVVEQLVNPLQKKQHLGQKVTDADYANVVKNAKVLFAQMQPEYRTKENLEAILDKMPEPVKEYMLKNKKGPC